MRNFLVVLLMIVVGFMVGFDIYHGFPAFAGAVRLLLAFGFAMSWVFALVGLVAVFGPRSVSRYRRAT